MGQLERYGLYVLVVVIFLILGVAIWGGDPASGQGGAGTAAGVPGALSVTEGEGGVTPSERLRDYFVDPDEAFEDVPERRRQPTSDPVEPRAAARDRQNDATAGVGAAAARSPGDADTGAVGGGSASVAPAQPVAAAVRKHKIADGEILEEISTRYYGSPRKWPHIVDANPGLEPNRLRPGRVIVIPELPGGAAVKRHTVRPRDNPAKISKKYYGTEAHAQLIMRENGIDDPRKLRIGSVLRIPPLPDSGSGR